jgi:hypothetical protein
MEEDVISALVNLGYQRLLAEAAAKKAIATIGTGGSFEQVFRETMGLMQK